MNRLLFAFALGSSALTGIVPTIAQAQENPPAAPLPPGPPPARPSGERMMMEMDADHDGVITRQEAIAAADRRFDALDTNHDGKITRDEMRAAHPRRDGWRRHRRDDANAPPPGMAGAAPPAPDGRPGPNGPRPGGMEREHHRDGDRVITREQFRKRALERFDRIDANHDGRIDASERAAYRELMKMRRIDRREHHHHRPPAPPAGETMPGPITPGPTNGGQQ